MDKLKAIKNNVTRYTCAAVALLSLIIALDSTNPIHATVLIGLAIVSGIVLIHSESKSIDIDELFK